MSPSPYDFYILRYHWFLFRIRSSQNPVLKALQIYERTPHMKSGYLLLLVFLFSEIAFAKWNVSQTEAEKFILQRLVISETTLDLEEKLDITVGVYPKSCYIREDGKASTDHLIIYYNPYHYFYNKDIESSYNGNIFFRPENLRILIDGVPMVALPADNIVGWHSPIEGNDDGRHSRMIGANYSMQQPFSMMFKKGSTLQLQNKDNDEIIAELPLKNSYNSYASADIHCRKSIHNTYYQRKQVEFGTDDEAILPMPDHIAEKLEKEQAKKSGRLWSITEHNVGKYIDARLWAMVSNPNMNNDPYDFYSCNENIKLVIGITPQVTAEEVFNVNYILTSKKTGESYKLNATSTRVLNPGAFVYLGISNYVYKKLDPKDTYVIKAVGTNAEQYTPGNNFQFKLANLPEVLSEVGQECAKLEAKYNVKAIQNQLNGFPGNVLHPSNRNDEYGPATRAKFEEIARWMRKYSLARSSAYDALTDAISFYNSYYDCEKVNYGNVQSMSDYELEQQIECNKNIAQRAANNGYQSAFRSAKFSVETSVHELKMRNSNNGFFSGILQGLVGAAAEIAGMEYGQDFSEISDSINSYIRNDSYMIQMNKHVYDINQYAQRSSSIDTNSSTGSSGSGSALRSANTGSASQFQGSIDSGNYTCSGPESENMQAYLGQQMQQSVSQASNNMCAQSRVMADELRKLIPYIQKCAPSDVPAYQEQIAYFDSRAQGSCVN